MAALSLPKVQAPARCSVELDVADALGVAYSIRTLARRSKMPPGTCEIYERVAAEMIRAAHGVLQPAVKIGGGR